MKTLEPQQIHVNLTESRCSRNSLSSLTTLTTTKAEVTEPVALFYMTFTSVPHTIMKFTYTALHQKQSKYNNVN